MPNILHHVSGLHRAIGSIRAADVLMRRLIKRRGAVRVRLVGRRTSIEIDPLDSDLFVAAQIFGHREYELSSPIARRLNAKAAELRRAGRTPVIIDGGANVGYSALFFADAFPEALVVALEPDPNTFAALQRNTRDQEQILPIQAALWSHENGVRLHSPGNGSWAHRVGETGRLTPSTTLDRLFAMHPEWAPLVVKLDIEGAENAVIDASPDVFRSVPCLMIEPHDFMYPGRACLAPLFKVFADRPMDTLLKGENLILLDPAITSRSRSGESRD